MRIDVNDFKQLARGSRLVSFSEDALETMFDYYEECENVEYDPVAFNCEWSEFSEKELIGQYDYLIDEDDEDDVTDRIVTELQSRTTIFTLDNGNYLILAF